MKTNSMPAISTPTICHFHTLSFHTLSKVLQTLLACAALMLCCHVGLAQATEESHEKLGTPQRREEPPPQAAKGPVAYMREAVGRVVASAKTQEKRGFHFLGIGCFFGTPLNPNQKVEESFELQKGITYVVIAGGDDNASDVDLLLYKNNKLITKDDDAARTAVVVYTCPRTERYRMVMQLKKSKTSSSYCSMSVLQKGGKGAYIIPVTSLETAIDNCLRNCINASLVLPSRFHDQANTWALYGVALSPKTGTAADPKPFAAGSYVMVGATDKSDAKIELQWIANGTKLLSHLDDLNKTHYMAYAAPAGKYSVGVFNQDPTGQSPSLVVTALLDRNEDYLKTLREAISKADFTLTGTWRDSSTKQEGIVILIVKGDNVEGIVTNDTGQLRSDIKGTLVKGKLEFQYRYRGGDESTATGTLRRGEKGHIVGTFDFTVTSSDERIGRGEVDLTELSKK